MSPPFSVSFTTICSLVSSGWSVTAPVNFYNGGRSTEHEYLPCHRPIMPHRILLRLGIVHRIDNNFIEIFHCQKLSSILSDIHRYHPEKYMYIFCFVGTTSLLFHTWAWLPLYIRNVLSLQTLSLPAGTSSSPYFILMYVINCKSAIFFENGQRISPSIVFPVFFHNFFFIKKLCFQW